MAGKYKGSVIYISVYRGVARIGEGMKAFPRTLEGMKLWRIFEEYEIL